MSSRSTRALALLSAALFLAVALMMRALVDGPPGQHSGTALSASMVYAAVFVVWPRATPVLAGAGAVAFSWAVECAQLTGVPAYLGERSPLARLMLGVQFDAIDVAWYPAGVVPLVALHW